ncbi:MAG: glycosyltransferase family 39 protein [Bacteroidales bacterium]|nr:glycosyltransferase family 39 protein [Bacteroidales bacterium]
MNIDKTPKRWQSALECLLLLALAAAMRALYLGKTDLGGDESFSLYVAMQSVPDIVRLLCLGDNPPLWELLLHFWTKIFGLSEIAIRSLSLIFSALTVIPIYLLGEKHLHRLVGIAASLFYCFSTFSIYLAHECRVYSLIGFATACSVFLFVSATQRPKPFKFILLTLANLMLMYGHYLSVWIIVMEFIIALAIRPIRTRIWKPYLIHAAALVLLFAPMFPILFGRFLDSGVNGTWIEKTTSPEALYDFLWRMCNEPVTTVLAISILAAALAKLVIDGLRKKAPFGSIGLLSLLWAVPLLVSFVLSYFTGFFLDRYFYFLFPVFYLCIAAYCEYLFPKRLAIGWAFMGLFAIAMAFSCSPNSSTKHFSGWHSPIKPIVNQLVEAKENENALVILPEYFDKQFTYYLDENHEAFRTQSKPSNYYVFRDYLTRLGYYYDYNYQDADFATYNEVVFTYRKDMPIEGLSNLLELNGFRFENEFEAAPYVVCHFSKLPSLPNSAKQEN